MEVKNRSNVKEGNFMKHKFNGGKNELTPQNYAHSGRLQNFCNLANKFKQKRYVFGRFIIACFLIFFWIER
jgi:hypothetical protein